MTGVSMMTGEELRRELPKAILGWYPFRKNTDKLIIDSDNIADWDKCISDSDYIIVTEAIETVQAPEQVLAALISHLKSGGRMFILMNNRLGIRYFCGDRDKYSGTVGDCLEDYKNADFSEMTGRMYDKTQITEMLNKAGIEHYRFFSVFPNLKYPALIFAEDYVPNEDITDRIIPAYNFPNSVFLEEKTLYKQLIGNGMLHQMANAYLIECSPNGYFSDVLHVTASLERGRGDALYTIVYRNDLVEKKPAYQEGMKRLEDIDKNIKELEARNIGVVKGTLSEGAYRMKFIHAKTTQLYLEELLRKSVDEFISKMDYFRNVILRSSEIVSEDKGDGKGAILKHGFVDMVPLNSFYVNGDFIFFDQEFCVDDYPANELIWRLVASFYAADSGADALCPMDRMLERYDLKRYKEKWQNMEWDFLKDLRNERILEGYHKEIRATRQEILKNRKWMNEPARYYELKHYDIFAGIEGKKLILFGAGKFAEKFREQYGCDFPIYAMLDNDESKTGVKRDEVRIETPEYLKTLAEGSFKVIICIKAYREAAKQLESMGIYDYGIYTPNKYYQTRPRTTIEIASDEMVHVQNKKYHVGYVAGAFDMFHIGHLNLIRRAKEQCEYLIVGVMSDEKMLRLKGKYPVIPCHERMQIVAGCRYVDRVEELPLDRAGIRDAYHMFHFDCMFSGDDHSKNQGWLDDREYLIEQGADIVFLPYTKEQSSTEIRNKL